MTTLHRTVPDYRKCRVMEHLGTTVERTEDTPTIPGTEKTYPVYKARRTEFSEERYLAELEKFERKCEKSLIETLARVDIRATVKSDPYSLPYKEEIVVRLNGESYLNGPYEFRRAARKIVKELLEKEVRHLRFYLFVNAVEVERGFLSSLGAIEYRFRYYEK